MTKVDRMNSNIQSNHPSNCVDVCLHFTDVLQHPCQWQNELDNIYHGAVTWNWHLHWQHSIPTIQTVNNSYGLQRYHLHHMHTRTHTAHTHTHTHTHTPPRKMFLCEVVQNQSSGESRKEEQPRLTNKRHSSEQSAQLSQCGTEYCGQNQHTSSLLSVVGRTNTLHPYYQ